MLQPKASTTIHLGGGFHSSTQVETSSSMSASNNYSYEFLNSVACLDLLLIIIPDPIQNFVQLIDKTLACEV